MWLILAAVTGKWGVGNGCSWIVAHSNPAGLGECHVLDTGQQREYYTPGIWRSAKKQETNPEREVGMHRKQLLSIYL